MEVIVPPLKQLEKALGFTVDRSGPEPWFTYKSFQGLREPYPIAIAVGSGVLYVLLVFVIWPLLRPTGKTTVGIAKTLRYWHNVFLCIFSGICCFSTLHFLLTEGENFFLGGKGYVNMVCAEPPEWMVYLSFVFTLSKIYEWIDTMWLVWLSPRGLNFLHVYHHATTFWLFLLVTDFPGCLKLGLLLNGGVHTLMYAHYAKPFPKAIVPLITISQIAQLVFVTYVWSITPGMCATYSTFADKYFFEFLTPYAFVPVYIIFFVKFFVGRFIFGGGKKKPSAKPTKKD